MPRYTAHAIHFSYHMKYKHHSPALDLRALPGDGADFFDIACEAWACVADRDEQKRRSFSTLPVQRRGRVALFKGRVGHYGTPAQIRDVTTGEVKLEHDGELANEPKVRLVLAVPATDPCLSAYMVVEEAREGSLKDPYIRALREIWNAKYHEFTLKIDNVVESEAWLATAQMAQMTVTYRDQQTDLADHGVPKVAGTVQAVLKPKKGVFFSRKTYELVKKNRKLAGRLVGRSETDEQPDSVSVKMVGQDGKEKTFAIDNERTPMARWVFSDWGAPALTDEQHIRKSLDQVQDLMHREGLEWDTRWERS